MNICYNCFTADSMNKLLNIITLESFCDITFQHRAHCRKIQFSVYVHMTLKDLNIMNFIKDFG